MTAPTLVATPDPGDTLTADITGALVKLAALGSPDRIAEHLQSEFVRGVCGDPGRCAIAAYVDHTVPRVRTAVLAVDTRMWSVFDPKTYDVDHQGLMPMVVAQFIRRFDAGGYPGLLTADSPRRIPAPF